MTAPAAMPPHIRYHAPDGGHVILRRRSTDAYTALMQFLERCTNWYGKWTRMSLHVTGAGPYMDSHDDPAPLIREVDRELSHGRDAGGIANFDAATGQFTIIQGSRTWDVPPDHHAWALEFVFRQPSVAQYQIPPVSCSFGAGFLLKHPGDGVMPPWPPPGSPDTAGWPLHHDCRLYAGAERSKVVASTDLVFPFDEPSGPFLDVVRAMRPHMAWRLSRANFRVVLPSRGREGYKLRKIDKSLFADL